MLNIRLELNHEEIIKLLGEEKELDGVVFTAHEGTTCVGYGIFKVVDETVYVNRCTYTDQNVLDGIVRAAINWATSLGVDTYDITRADIQTLTNLRSVGYQDHGSWEELLLACKGSILGKAD